MDVEWDTDIFRTRVVKQPHEGVVYVERTQPNESHILAVNAELQKESLIKDLSFGRWVARIPEIAFATIIPRDYPEYLTSSGNEKKAILMRMLAEHKEWCIQPMADIIVRQK